MNLSPELQDKIRSLPDQPGVYLMRDKYGTVIYVGKAVSLRNRVRHYFQQGTLRSADPKLRGLIRSIEDFEFITVRTEADALITEGRLIKEYKPRYNVSFRDDKRFLLIRIHLGDPFPRFETCRIRKSDGATYFGPYVNAVAARAAVAFVEKTFGLRVCASRVPGDEQYRHCHNDVIRFCSAPCVGKISSDAYRAQAEQACAFLRGERREELQRLEEEMQEAAARKDYENAAALRDTLFLLRQAIRTRSRGLKDLSLQAQEAQEGLAVLREALQLPTVPRVIECFDISNISGTHAVASMVCAVDGLPARNRYRRYRIRTVEGIDDPLMMREVILRRYRRVLDEQAALPDLILIDGGPTQLGMARDALRELDLASVPSVGLAKKLEEVYLEPTYLEKPVRLPRDEPAMKVLRRIRDEAHRFALTHHRTLRARRIRDSFLDEIEGIGDKRKEWILKHFGSVQRLNRATVDEIAAVPGIGPVMAEAIRAGLDRRHPSGGRGSEV